MSDPAIFAAVRLDRGIPVWSDDLDLSTAALRAWAEAGHVLSAEETGKWWAKHSAPAAIAI